MHTFVAICIALVFICELIFALKVDYELGTIFNVMGWVIFWLNRYSDKITEWSCCIFLAMSNLLLMAVKAKKKEEKKDHRTEAIEIVAVQMPVIVLWLIFHFVYQPV